MTSPPPPDPAPVDVEASRRPPSCKECGGLGRVAGYGYTHPCECRNVAPAPVDVEAVDRAVGYVHDNTCLYCRGDENQHCTIYAIRDAVLAGRASRDAEVECLRTNYDRADKAHVAAEAEVSRLKARVAELEAERKRRIAMINSDMDRIAALEAVLETVRKPLEYVYLNVSSAEHQRKAAYAALVVIDALAGKETP